MKRMENLEKYFDEDVQVYDFGAKDIFGHKFYVAYHRTLNSIRFVAKNKDYAAKRKNLDKAGLSHVIVRRFDDVIDLSDKTFTRIMNFFPGCKYPMNLNLYD